MQYTDTDIDLALDDRDAELVFESTGWNRLVHGSSIAAGVAALAAVPADMRDLSGLFDAAVAAFILAFLLAGLGLVMEYRADRRAIHAGGHGE